MSYLDPHGASEPRGWERPGDQRDPEWAGRDDARPPARPGGAWPAAYPGDPDQPTGSPRGVPASYEPTPSGYGTGYPPDTSGYPPDTFTYPADTAAHRPARLPYGADQAYPMGPTAYRQNAAPATGHPGWETRAEAPSRGQMAPDGYHSGGHEAGPSRPDDHRGDPYLSHPYSPDPHESHPYPADPYRSGPYRDGPPATDPYADTQFLPRIGAERSTEPTDGADRMGSAPAATSGEPAAKPRASRAGRNLPAAIGVGLALGALIAVPLFVYPPAFVAVVIVAASIGSWELARAVRQGSGAQPPLPPLLGGGLLMVGLAWWAGPDALSLALLVTVLATLVWRLGDGPRGFQRDLTAAALIAVYVPFLGGFAALLTAVPDDGHLRVLVTLVAVVLSDTGGYAAGVTFGKHPMAPLVSPKKSWEGFAGSVLAAAGGSAVLLWYLLDVAPLWGALFGAAISVCAVLGDLGESMIKRDLGVKDMSNLLPGHGGLMDRLDSVLLAMPVAYLLLAIFVPAG